MSEVKTRIIHLEGGQQRREATNTGTLYVVFDQSVESDSFRNVFVKNYKKIRQNCTSFSQPGLSINAFEIYSGKYVGSLAIAAKIGTANSAIVGRHGMADLYLDGDASLSLRHLAIVVAPLENSEEVRFRIIDLRTSSGFHDEHRKRYESLVSEGPIFVRCGSYVLFFFITGDQIAWPESADDGWACIPDRVYLDEDAAEPDRWQRKRKLGKKKNRDASGERRHGDRQAITHVHSVHGPVRARARLLEAGEEPLGTLRLSSDAGMQKVIIGQRAAYRGVLLGRYERCDVDGSQVLTDDRISRVHLLLISISGRLYALDTASTHGTWVGDEEREIRILPLDTTLKLTFGDELAFLRWSPST